MTDGKPQEQTPEARLQRVYRERKKSGVKCVQIEVSYDDADALVDAGYLRFEDSEDRDRIGEALKELLDGLPGRYA